MEKRLIGVSACLLGERVRYDGELTRDAYISGTLAQKFEWVAVCPEVEIGLSVPRERIQLEGDPVQPRLVMEIARTDLTDRMHTYCEERVAAMASASLCGYVFKSKSPSCGLKGVKLFPAGGGEAVRQGIGFFARAFMTYFPLVPVVEERDLQDSGGRENFIERLFVMQRWRALLNDDPDPAGLVTFHTQHKYLLMAHSILHYRELGKRVAGMKGQPLTAVLDQYGAGLMEALRLRATVKKHVNVLQHLAGYFKRQWDRDEKWELQEQIAQYAAGQVAWGVPVAYINQLVHTYDEPYLRHQFYLHPHPIERQLRHRV